VNEHIRKPITHSAECNINGYGYCDCGADPDRYLSESDVNDILKSHKEVIEHLREYIKSLTNTKQKSGKEWVGLTEDEIVGHTCECVDDGTFNMKCAIDFANFIQETLKRYNT
jgi:hypothetical protein